MPPNRRAIRPVGRDAEHRGEARLELVDSERAGLEIGEQVAGLRVVAEAVAHRVRRKPFDARRTRANEANTSVVRTPP